jgi:UDP-glucuronate decarboxylase
MRVLITGGAGFLGSNLSRKFLAGGHDVIALDDLSTGTLENLRDLESSPNFEFVEWDVRQPYDFSVDLLLNFACPASPIHYQKDPVRTIETNFLGMVNALHLARKVGARVVQASTSEIYGDPAISPQHEKYWGNVNPVGIRSCYDEGKRAAETLCFDYRRQFGLDVRVLRIFNTYGPGMSIGDGRVVSNFVVQAIQGKKLTVYGDGTQTRSFCFVEDLVNAIYLAALRTETFDSPMNIGNPNTVTMLELAETVAKLVNSNLEIETHELPSDDPTHRKPDISIAKELLGWEPQIDLASGLRRTIQYFESLLSK